MSVVDTGRIQEAMRNEVDCEICDKASIDAIPWTDADLPLLDELTYAVTLNGMGFNIAMRDMEICGTGNLLGKEQHGTMNAIGFELSHLLLSRCFLLRRKIVDRGTVLRADIRSLAVQRSGVMDREEDVEEVAERDDPRVEIDAHHLGMSGRARTHLLVRRSRDVTAGVAGFHALHAAQVRERGLQAPEAAAAENGAFGVRRCVVVPVHPAPIMPGVRVVRRARASRRTA